MTPRGFLNFFRSRTGAFLLFLLLLCIGYIMVNGFKAPNMGVSAKPISQGPEKTAQKPQVVETVTRDMTAFHPPQDKPAPAPPVQTKEAKKQEPPPALPPISLYAETVTPGADKPMDTLGADYAPFGRLVPCELVVTVDSSSISTPIIGLVTDDVWHDGRLIIPAGAEVHGTAKVDTVRERIASGGNWTLVWQGGEELSVTGMALDREMQEDGNGWGITDGSAGLRGRIIKSDSIAEAKLFAATFLSGAADGLTTKVQTILGSQVVSSVQNASLTGAQAILNAYAKQILDTIQREGFYVRVPAGKQFYLYVTQTLDRSKATIGATRLAALKNTNEAKEDANDPLVRLRKNLQRLTSPGGEPTTDSPRQSPANVTSPQSLLFR
jgi:hypothetical protein